VNSDHVLVAAQKHQRLIVELIRVVFVSDHWVDGIVTFVELGPSSKRLTFVVLVLVRVYLQKILVIDVRHDEFLELGLFGLNL
jgi:hypothetical protein